MNQQSSVKFYEIRSIRECISVTCAFVSQNRKSLSKNLLYIGLPLILFVEYMKQTFLLKASFSTPLVLSGITSWVEYIISQILAILPPIFIFSVIGVILVKYINKFSIQSIRLIDQKKILFSFMSKLIIQWLITITTLAIVLLLITKLIGEFLAALFMIAAWEGGNSVFGWILALLWLLSIAVLHPIILSVFPVFFEETSAWEGLRKGWSLGFKYWKSNFFAVLLCCVFMIVVNFIFFIPYRTLVGGAIGRTVLWMFGSLGGLITYPIIAIFLSFHYASIIAQEQLKYDMQVEQIEIQEEKAKEFEEGKIKEIQEARIRLRKEREDPRRFMPSSA